MILLAAPVALAQTGSRNGDRATGNHIFPDSVWFKYREVPGIGSEPPFSRRDPSDVIRVGDKYYVWYTRMKNEMAGYWGTIWYAVSSDEGYTWQEKGEALGTGSGNAFDSHAVFTPNIIFDQGKYYLFYTGVKPTPGRADLKFENNSETDITAIGVAVSVSPDGPFERITHQPVLEVSADTAAFDSYRVDDAALTVIDGAYRLYYKGRSRKDGKKGPLYTKMGVATARHPAGPYKKHGAPLLDRSHEVLVWNHRGGIAALASLSQTLEFSEDGLIFASDPKYSKKVQQLPKAPGFYRPDLTDHTRQTPVNWGISMDTKNGCVHLLRFEMKSRSTP